MDLTKLTQKSQQVLQQSQTLAQQHQHQNISPMHMLHAMLMQSDGLVPQILSQCQLATPPLLQVSDQALQGMPRVQGSDQIYMGQDSQKILDAAFQHATRMQDDYVSVEHILLALCDSKNPAAQLLKEHGLNNEALRTSIASIRGSQRVTNDSPEASYDALNKYGIDLVQLAKQGKLDPVIGRDTEIRSVIR